MKESKLILMQNRVAKLEQQLVGVMKIIASTQGYSRSVAVALQEHLGEKRRKELVEKIGQKEIENQVEQIKKDEKK